MARETSWKTSQESLRGLKIAHLIPYLGRPQGGPVFSLAAMAALQAERHCRVSIFSTVLGSDGEQMTFDPSVEVHTFPASKCVGFRRSPALWRYFQSNPLDFDVIHSHSLWTDIHRLAYHLSRGDHGRRIPHILAPCGTLTSRALQRFAWKKLPVRLWFQDQALRTADCLHAKSEKEYEEIRAYGLRNPVALIPNPVAPAPETGLMAPEEFRRKYSIPPGKRIVLYLGRIHPVKGVARLLEAWGILGERSETVRASWALVLAGPDEGGYLPIIEAQARRLDSQSGKGANSGAAGAGIYFTGNLDNIQKWSALRASEIFVMPSDFENFGMSIAEAMMAGLPVIATRGTPWKSLKEQGAGWWVDISSEGVADALEEAMRMPAAGLRARGEKARALAALLRPDVIGDLMISIYEWLAGNSKEAKAKSAPSPPPPPEVRIHD